jgi:hypothetical protein
MALRNGLDLKDECRPRRGESGRLRRFDGTARTWLKIAQCAMQLFNWRENSIMSWLCR